MDRILINLLGDLLASPLTRMQRPTGYRGNYRGSIAVRNRWTGHPHENKREIARRLRQAARDA